VRPASAAIDPANYHHVDVIRDYPAPYGFAGGYISCPPGMKAVSSGAISSELRRSLWTAGLTTFDGNGVFVTALGDAGEQLQLSARCIDAAQVQGSTLATLTIRDHRPLPVGYVHAGRATCPPGTVAYGGGGFVSRPGSQPFGTGGVFASMPQANGAEWFFAAMGSLFPDTELWISTHCLPRSQFGQIFTVTETDTAPPGTPGPGTNYPVLFAGARCPAGSSAYAGGAWLHSPNLPPAWLGYLTVSTMTADDRGWFARAWTFLEGAQLTATVQCMTRVID
jgi:hypothetical protein